MFNTGQNTAISIKKVIDKAKFFNFTTMNLRIIFLLIFLFSALFVGSFMFGIPDKSYGKAVNVAAQVGLGVSILGFFVLRIGKKRSN